MATGDVRGRGPSGARAVLTAAVAALVAAPLGQRALVVTGAGAAQSVVDAVAAKVALCAWAGRRRVGEMRKGILYG